MPHDHEHHHDEGHAHGEAHDHAHGHDHAAVPVNIGRAFVIGIALNVLIVVVEVVYGLTSRSMALVADAGHNLSDVLGLVLAWGALVLAKRKPTVRRTYGFRRSSILAALANAMLLFVATGAVVGEAIERLRDPGKIEGKTIIAVAAVAVVVNGTSALLFMAGRKGDLNVQSAFLHLAGDAAIALGVVLSGVAIVYTGWNLIDPIVSIVISVLILVGTWSLLRKSVNLVLDAVPEGVDPDKVRSYLGALPGVVEVHDLHIWAMSTTETALTAHLVMPLDEGGPSFVGEVCRELRTRFEIIHSTIQIEALGAPRHCEPCVTPTASEAPPTSRSAKAQAAEDSGAS